ncbi:hypothetical protein [Mycolicibacterium arseniciresistens]|uniref:UsfY protein n=1 Tax=Mycolicibacterium arseniciresistens TaxID=3062257 RepID=A0ABT8UCQ2_9MYCO|nr:hypothetical protein [Mycolicibacterium arseniciresistens]MDO3634590.1 hypothetical protein [Mycolicibacterium arseniciresistens]
MIVALHLGLGGAALAASAWTGWIGNAVLVGIVGAAVVVGAHVIAGRFAYRSGKAVHARWKLRRPSPRTSAEDTNGEHT